MFNTCWNTCNCCRNVCGETHCGFCNTHCVNGVATLGWFIPIGLTNTTTNGGTSGNTESSTGCGCVQRRRSNGCGCGCNHFGSTNVTSGSTNTVDLYYARQYGLYPYQSNGCGCGWTLF